MNAEERFKNQELTTQAIERCRRLREELAKWEETLRTLQEARARADALATRDETHKPEPPRTSEKREKVA
jgi:hypothetical protein